MKLKYLLKRNVSIKNSYIIIIMITVILLVGGAFSFAILTATSESKGALNIVTGNLYPYIESTDLDSDNKIVVGAGKVKKFIITLKNINTIDAKFNLYYDATSTNIEIGYLASKDAAPTTAGYTLGKSGSTTESKEIYVQIKNNDLADVTVTFGSDVGLVNDTLDFPSDKNILSLVEERTTINENIVAAYTYNPSSCVTGEEDTCTVSDCFYNKDTDSCPAGTIIKYNVNDTETKYFYVLHDDGTTLTMQHRENTVYNKRWYNSTSDINSNGPTKVLGDLETATSGWNNVNDQIYTMGTTNFNGTNAYTGCTASSGNTMTCTTNAYTLGQRTGKARMITGQETAAMGCKLDENQSCPIWMRNYLYDSTSYGGTVSDNTQRTDDSGNLNYNYGYWTMSASSSGTTNAWNVTRQDGTVFNIGTADTGYGARAVVVIDK